MRADGDRILQEARAAVERAEYPAATAAVAEVPDRVAAEIARLDDLATQRPARRRR
jgi:hypothetical protein